MSKNPQTGHRPERTYEHGEPTPSVPNNSAQRQGHTQGQNLTATSLDQHQHQQQLDGSTQSSIDQQMTFRQQREAMILERAERFNNDALSGFFSTAEPQKRSIKEIFDNLESALSGKRSTANRYVAVSKLLAKWCLDVHENDVVYNAGMLMIHLQSATPDQALKDSIKRLSFDKVLSHLYEAVFDLVQGAFRNAQAQGTVFAFAAERPLLFDDPELSRIVMSNATWHELSKRHVQLKDSPICNISFRRGMEIPATVWQDAPSRVFIMGGSSGCGKTICSFKFGKWNCQSVVFYLRTKDVFSNTLRIVTKYSRDESNNRETLERCAKYELACDDDLPANDTERRNEMVRERIANAVKALVGSYALASCDDPSLSFSSYWSSLPVVVIVIDEIGEAPLTLRGLCGCADELSKDLHEMLFGYKINDAKDSRIRFLAAGTGANYSTVLAGSDPTRYFTLKLDLDKETPTDVFKHLVETSLRGDQHKTLRDNLLRLLRKTNDKLSLAEEIAADLITNPRCAALLVQLAVEHALEAPWDWVNSSIIYQQQLNSWIPIVVQQYISLNGLKNFRDPLRTIVLAMAVSLHGIPDLPVQHNGPILAPFVSETSDVGDEDLYFKLCTRAGILIDTAFPVLRPSPQQLDITNFVTMDDTAKTSLKTGRAVLERHRSRFFFAPAHVAMFRWFVLGLDPCRDTDHGTGLKFNSFDFCTTGLACSSAFRALLALVGHHKFANFHAAADLKGRVFSDPLHGLKGALSFLEADKEIEGVTSLSLRTSALQLLNLSLAVPDAHDEVLEKAREAAAELKAVIGEKMGPNKKRAVVLLSPDMEQFADAVFVGPGRVGLIQCKQRIEHNQSASPIKYLEELDKMHLLQPVADNERVVKGTKEEEEQRRRQIRSVYFQALIEAASSSAVDTPAPPGFPAVIPDDVKVFCWFVVDGSPAALKYVEKNLFDAVDVKKSCAYNLVWNPKAKTYAVDPASRRRLVAGVASVQAVIILRPNSTTQHNAVLPSPFFPLPQSSFVADEYSTAISEYNHKK